MRHIEHGDARAGIEPGFGVREHIELAAPRPHFLQIRFHLLEPVVLRRHRDYRHLFVHKRERAVLEFAGSIGFGVQVGDFLELERALHGDRVHRPAPQKQGVLLVDKLFGQFANGVVELEHLLDGFRDAMNVLRERAPVGAIALEHAGKQQQTQQLRREGFSRRHADFRSCVGHQHQVGFAGERGFRLVADGQRGHVSAGVIVAAVAEGLGIAQRGERIGGLARLRKRHEQAVLGHHRVAIAIFARQFDVAGNTRHRFEPVARDQPGMMTGTAGHDMDRLDAFEQRLGLGADAGGKDIVGRDPALPGFGQRPRLLVDLLEHEMAIVAFLGRRDRQPGLLDLAFDDLAFAVENVVALRAHDHQVAFLEVDEIAGDRQQCCHIGGDEMLADAHAKHQRGAAACCHKRLRIVAADHGQCIGAVQLVHGRAHRACQIGAGAEMAVDQMGDHFRIGLRREFVALVHEPRAQRLEVLDDAVVHNGDALGRDMRMGVGLRHTAMRGPAGMGDAQAAGARRLVEPVGERLYLADRAGAIQRAVVHQRQTGGIVAAIFEPAQPFEQNGFDITLGAGPDNSAHSSVPSFVAPRRERPAR